MHLLFNIDALLSLFDQSSIAKLNDSQYYLALELCKFLEKKNQDSLYLWTYKDTKAPIVSYLESEYGYNPEHTYWASNPLELLDYIRDTCQVPENKIVFVDYQANKSLPYQTALSKTQYTRIGPLDFIVESESRHYRETKKYISCYAKEFMKLCIMASVIHIDAVRPEGSDEFLQGSCSHLAHSRTVEIHQGMFS